jgi:hypothetical protein
MAMWWPLAVLLQTVGGKKVSNTLYTCPYESSAVGVAHITSFVDEL